MNDQSVPAAQAGAPAAGEAALLRPLGWIVAADVFAIMLLTAIDVAGRYIFNAPVSGASYIVALLLGVMIFGALPLATARDEHLRAGLLDHLFTGVAKRLKECFTLLVSLAALTALAFVLWNQGVVYGRTNAQLPSIGVSLASIAYLGAAMSAASAAIVLITAVRSVFAVFRQGDR